MKLYLGITPKFWPWIEESTIAKKMKETDTGIIFSYWVFRKMINSITSKGMRDFFSWDGSIMIDSGAYSAYNSGHKIKWLDYLSFLKKIEIDSNVVVVNLDVVGDKDSSEKNWNSLQSQVSYPIMPVFHHPNVVNYSNEVKYVGLGGVVNALKINQKGSVYDIAKWVANLGSKKNYHGFGIGSPYNQIIFEDYLYSVDWIGWRRNAAQCNIYTPEGSREIVEARRKPSNHKSMKQDLFEKYKPSFIDSYELLHKKGTLGWNWRALWNVWYFLTTEKFKNEMKKANYVSSIRKSMIQYKYKDVRSLFNRRVLK